MKTATQKDKEALIRWQEHCHCVKTATAKQTPISEKDRSLRIAKARASYEFFVQTYFPHLATKPCGKFQIKAADYIKNNEKARAVLEWARGHAKSSHISLMVPLWLLMQIERKPMVMVLVSKSQEAAKRLLSDLQAELEYNELYSEDFGKQKGSGMWTDGEFVTAAGDMFIALGRGQSPRGIKKRGVRVNYISIDDIDDDEMVRNPRRVKEAVDWCLSALYGTMDGGRGRFIVVGNRIAKKSILSELAERPNWYHTVVNMLDKNGKPSWSENYTLAEVNLMKKDIGERLFQKEYMNNPISEGTVFEQKYIRYESILPLRQYRALVCYTDPSFKSSSTADYKATLLVGVTQKGSYHIIKAFADQTKVSDMVDWHYHIRAFVGDVPLRYYMESNFIQDLLMDEFKKEGSQRGVQIPIVGDARKKPDKFARIENMQPLFQRGEIIFNEKEKTSQGMEVLVEQLLMFEKGSRVHDDAPDALEGAIWLLSNTARTYTQKYVVGKRPNRGF